VDIGDDDVDRAHVCGGDLNGLLRPPGAENAVAVLAQHRLDEGLQLLVVFADEDCRAGRAVG
jgi:hypothetical protein